VYLCLEGNRLLDCMAQTLFLFAVCPRNGFWFRSGCRVKQGQCEAHAPVRSVTRAVGVVLAADLKADRLLPNLQNLADLKNERHGPFRVAWSVVPVGRGFRTEGESRVRLQRVCYKGLKEHLAETATMFLDGDGPELVHKCAGSKPTNLFEHHNRRTD